LRNARIDSLAKTHTLLSRSHWQDVHLDDLVRGELAFFANGESVVIKGPQLTWLLKLFSTCADLRRQARKRGLACR